jgi:hypothetical protein
MHVPPKSYLISTVGGLIPPRLHVLFEPQWTRRAELCQAISSSDTHAAESARRSLLRAECPGLVGNVRAGNRLQFQPDARLSPQRTMPCGSVGLELNKLSSTLPFLHGQSVSD